MRSAFVYHPDLATFEFSADHPFKPSRAKRTLEMCDSLGLLDYDWVRVVEGRECTVDELRPHLTPDYLAALEFADAGRFDPRLFPFGLGSEDCPVFPGLFRYCRLVAGSTLAGCDLLLRGEADRVFHPSGGLHHAGPDHAEGFCYVNDCVMAIRRFLDAGKRVAYVDIDAHHGNGVQNALYADGRVLKVSVHETGRTLYPWGGFETELGDGDGLGRNVNVPLEPESDDEVFIEAWNTILAPVIRDFAPDVVVAELGIDAVRADPLTHLALTNNGFAHAVDGIAKSAPLCLALGGGGYSLDAVVRGWTLAWAVMNGLERPEDEFLGSLGGVFLGDASLGVAGLRDMRAWTAGAPAEIARRELARVRAFLASKGLPVRMPGAPPEAAAHGGGP
jgi:acetoin utilization protein AcuC